MLWLILLVFLLLSLFFFSSWFSPIPYFPSNKEVVKRMRDLFEKDKDLRTVRYFIDVGAGDGRVVFNLEKILGARADLKFVAIEINPLLIALMWVKKFLLNSKVEIVFKDMFEFSYPFSEKAIYYLYVSPQYLDKFYSFLKEKKAKGFLISYFYKPKSVIADKVFNLNNGRKLYIIEL